MSRYDKFIQDATDQDRDRDTEYPVKKTDAEWREQLDPTQYQVARHAATERDQPHPQRRGSERAGRDQHHLHADAVGRFDFDAEMLGPGLLMGLGLSGVEGGDGERRGSSGGGRSNVDWRATTSSSLLAVRAATAAKLRRRSAT